MRGRGERAKERKGKVARSRLPRGVFTYQSRWRNLVFNEWMNEWMNERMHTIWIRSSEGDILIWVLGMLIATFGPHRKGVGKQDKTGDSDQQQQQLLFVVTYFAPVQLQIILTTSPALPLSLLSFFLPFLSPLLLCKLIETEISVVSPSHPTTGKSSSLHEVSSLGRKWKETVPYVVSKKGETLFKKKPVVWMDERGALIREGENGEGKR